MIAPTAILAQTATPQTPSALMDYVLLACLIGAIAVAALVGFRDIIRFSPGRLWALAAQTFRESVRRRVLMLVPAAMLLTLAFGLFQHSFNEVGDIHQTTETCIRVTSALTLLLVILLSAFSFPREFESRTIYSLVTKPITRLEIFLGKLMGLWLVALVVLVLMGGFSYGYLHVRAARLARQASATLDAQRQAYDRWQQAHTGPTSRPAAPGDLPPDRPDESTGERLRLGLLTAANYIDSAPVRVRPMVPPELRGRPRRDWVLSNRGYAAVYTIDLPPVVARTSPVRFAVAMDIPSAGANDRPTVVLRLLLDSASADTTVPGWDAPAAAVADGWIAGVGEPMALTLKRDPVSGVCIGIGDSLVSPEFLRSLGSVSRVGVLVELPGPVTRLIGLLPPTTEPGQPTGLIIQPEGASAQFPLLPTAMRVFARSRSVQRFPVNGTPPGQPVEVAEYRFASIPTAQLPDGDLVFQLNFAVDAGSHVGQPSEARIIATNRVGETLELTALPSTRVASFVRVPRDFAGGDLTLQIHPVFEDDSFTLGSRSVRLRATPTPFAMNLARSLAISALQAFAVTAIGVMASVFLSWPVALLLTSVLWVAGNLLDVVRGMSAAGRVQIFQVTGENHAIDMASRAGNTALDWVGAVVTRVVPDFSRFEPVAFIGQGLAVPFASLRTGALWALAYMGVAMALGYLLLRSREVAR